MRGQQLTRMQRSAAIWSGPRHTGGEGRNRGRLQRSLKLRTPYTIGKRLREPEKTARQERVEKVRAKTRS